MSIENQSNQVIAVTPENISTLKQLLYWIAPNGEYRKLYDYHDMSYGLTSLENICILESIGLPMPKLYHTDAKKLVQITNIIVTKNPEEFKENSENRRELWLFREFLMELKLRYSHDRDVLSLLQIPIIEKLIETQN